MQQYIQLLYMQLYIQLLYMQQYIQLLYMQLCPTIVVRSGTFDVDIRRIWLIIDNLEIELFRINSFYM